jgi:hypothetical protein
LDSSSEGLACYFEDEYGYVEDGYGSGSGDGVEEANAADDMIKIMEGDW